MNLLSIESILFFLVAFLGALCGDVFLGLILRKFRDNYVVAAGVQIVMPKELRERGYKAGIFASPQDGEALTIAIYNSKTEIKEIKQRLKDSPISEVERL